MVRSSLARLALVVCLAFIATPGMAKTIKVPPENSLLMMEK
jgi:hypothetical protein